MSSVRARSTAERKCAASRNAAVPATPPPATAPTTSGAGSNAAAWCTRSSRPWRPGASAAPSTTTGPSNGCWRDGLENRCGRSWRRAIPNHKDQRLLLSNHRTEVRNVGSETLMDVSYPRPSTSARLEPARTRPCAMISRIRVSRLRRRRRTSSRRSTRSETGLPNRSLIFPRVSSIVS